MRLNVHERRHCLKLKNVSASTNSYSNHSTVVNHLEAKGIHSVYHKHFLQAQGVEQHPTFYLYRHKDKPYHLDYCFASADMLAHLVSVEVGEHEFWPKYSDHVPVMVTFDDALFDKKTKTKKAAAEASPTGLTRNRPFGASENM